jgi:hypothetical protein
MAEYLPIVWGEGLRPDSSSTIIAVSALNPVLPAAASSFLIVPMAYPPKTEIPMNTRMNNT